MTTAALPLLQVYKIDSDWFVAESPGHAKRVWESFYGTEWEGDDPTPAPDDELLEIEERGPNDEDLVKSYAEWALFNGPGWLAHEI